MRHFAEEFLRGASNRSAGVLGCSLSLQMENIHVDLGVRLGFPRAGVRRFGPLRLQYTVKLEVMHTATPWHTGQNFFRLRTATARSLPDE
jgi:hypothetical protein